MEARPHMVELREILAATGIPVQESDRELVVRTAENKLVRFDKSAIEDPRRTETENHDERRERYEPRRPGVREVACARR